VTATMTSAKVLNLYIALSLFFITFQKLYSQSDVAVSREECQKLIDKGAAEMEKNNFAAALELFTKAEVIAEKKQWKDKLFFIKGNLGILYGEFTNSGESLGYYLKALQYAKGSPELEKRSITIINNIGLLYTKEKDYRTAFEYYGRALTLAKEQKSDYNIILASLNISSLYNDLGDYKAAQKYLRDINSIPKARKFERGVKINYSESLMVEGKVAEAQRMMEELIRDVDRLNDVDDCYVCIVELLSKIYNKQQKIDLAISFAQKGLQNTRSITDKADLYQQLSDLYFKKKEYQLFKSYKDSVQIAKDSVAASINRGLYESNKVKLKVQEYKNELEVKTEKQQTERLLFIVGILFTLMLFWFVYRSQKNRIVKQKQEKVIVENQQQIADLEIENLKSSIAEKNRKLSAKALYLSGRNELIESVINSLTQIPEIAHSKDVNDYVKTLRTYLKTDEEWDDFINYFGEVNPDFLRTLTAMHPDLNPADIRFLCYIYMNLDLREVGNIFNITYNAALKRQRRIKEKMEIDKDISLYDYLLQLV
jgi:tetratricopeptide (TPR) repeat protein